MFDKNELWTSRDIKAIAAPPGIKLLPAPESILPREVIDPLFDLLESCKGVTQMEEHHPEGDVFVHSCQVLHWALKESQGDVDLVLAAMLHDIGKKENSLGHDDIGAKMLEGKVSAKTQWLIKNHMRVHFLIKGQTRRLKKVMSIVNHPWLPELVLLARWDKIGRNPNFKLKYDRERFIARLEKVAKDHFKKGRE